MAKGFHQTHGFEFTKTLSHVVKLATIRVILTLAMTHQWYIHQLDVKKTFLNGFLNEEVYMQQSQGFDDGNLLCKSWTKLFIASNKNLDNGLNAYNPLLYL